MKNSKSTDLTEGPVYRCILIFTLPILASHIFQNLYNSVDSIVVGNYVGKTALAAVGASSDISALLTGFFTGLSTGAGVLFARYFGAKKYDKLHDSIHTALTFSLLIGVAMAILGVIFSPALLHMVDCPADVYDEALSYLRIYFIGVLFTAIYNVGAGVLRAVGDSRRPFIYLVIASVINIILDLVTVKQLQMGVMGVALATIVSQLVSVILVFRTMLSTDDVYRVRISDLKIDPDMLRDVIRLGIPAAIQSSIISLSNLFVQKYLNAFGSGALAGSTAAKKVDRFVGMIGQSIGQATAPYVSQNIGAKNRKRVTRGLWAVTVISGVCFVVLALIMYSYAESLIRLFTDDAEAVGYGIRMMKIMVPFYFIQSLMQIFANAVRGFGRSAAVMVWYLLGMVGCRQLFLAVSMHFNHVIDNVFYAFPVGWFFGFLFVAGYYFIYRKQLMEEAFGPGK